MKILILGGASGFGKEFVREYAKESNEIIVVDKNKENLNHLKKEFSNIKIECYDLTQKENLETVFKTYKDVDLVVNSAGIGYLGNFFEVSYEEELEVLKLDVYAFHFITKKFLEEFVKREKGGLINICSIASFVPMPNFNMYGAVKAFDASYTIAAQKELKKEKNIHIMALCPGVTYTGFLSKEKFDEIINKFGKWAICRNPNKVVRKAIKQYNKNKVVYVPGVMNKIIYVFDKLSPLNISTGIISKIFGYAKRGNKV